MPSIPVRRFCRLMSPCRQMRGISSGASDSNVAYQFIVIGMADIDFQQQQGQQNRTNWGNILREGFIEPNAVRDFQVVETTKEGNTFFKR
jgi:hypothetical protein